MIKINIRENIYNIKIEDLISIGYRNNNSKRSFLFISKVLGKHIEIRPNMCKVIGLLLASIIFGENRETSLFLKYIKNQNLYEEKIRDAIKLIYKTKDKVTVLGFAETATGLGMAVASVIEDSYYITTTREDIKGIKPLFNFEEEHSHSTTHKCFPKEPNKLKEADKIILVDDEITTGNSMLNIIKELSKVTNVKKYIILSILDLRNIQDRNRYKEFIYENSLDIQVKSLISGEISTEENKKYFSEEEMIINEVSPVTELKIMTRRGKYLRDTGRFGVNFKDIIKIEDECIKVANEIQKIVGKDKKLLVLGHGENIYIPSRIASYLYGDIYFRSTTRSPIYCLKEKEYLINERNIYFNNGDKYYLYNKTSIENEYDYVILVVEDDLNIKLTKNSLVLKL